MDKLQTKETDKWAVVVCFGTIITFIAGIGSVNSFGLIYNDFMIQTQSSAKSITTAHGVFAIMLAVGGIILDGLSKRFSLQTAGLFGAFAMQMGKISTIFITDTNQLSLTFGILQGLGFGMMVPVCYSTLNYYFLKKRTTVMSICKAVQGIVVMWFPQLVRKLMTAYGFRGTLLILSGIALHSIPGMLTMNADKKTPRNSRTAKDVKQRGKRHESDDLLKANNPSIKLDIGTDPDKYVSNKRFYWKNVINLGMLKNPIYCNICFGQSFVNFSDLTFFILQPMLLLQYGYDTAEVATCISICGIADVTGRCTLAVISYFIPINVRFLFYITTLFTLLFRLVMLQVNSFLWMAIVTAVLGLLRAWLHVVSPLVISSHASQQDFPAAYALYMLSAGVINVTFSPLIGLLKDEYQDYEPAFYALALCCIPCLVLWLVEYILKNKNNLIIYIIFFYLCKTTVM